MTGRKTVGPRCREREEVEVEAKKTLKCQSACLDSHDACALAFWQWEFRVEVCSLTCTSCLHYRYSNYYNIWDSIFNFSRLIYAFWFLEITCVTSLPQCPYPFVSLQKD